MSGKALFSSLSRSNHEHRPDPQHQNENARNSLSSEEIASDEGLEEAPSQSEGEGGPEANNNNVDESSPEREMESDWSSGPSEAQRQVSQEEAPSAPEVLPVPAPPPADPQDYRVYFYDPKAVLQRGLFEDILGGLCIGTCINCQLN